MMFEIRQNLTAGRQNSVYTIHISIRYLAKVTESLKNRIDCNLSNKHFNEVDKSWIRHTVKLCMLLMHEMFSLFG